MSEPRRRRESQKGKAQERVNDKTQKGNKYSLIYILVGLFAALVILLILLEWMLIML